ncbi:MAG: response regulator transcription factor, partial [Flavobacteriaceae bacterium]|nr:response regulator transcription factor [Flavobacteriaceae bacterium]
MIKVGVIEDEEYIRESLSILINGSDGFTCEHTYETAEEAIDKIPLLNLDVVLIDIQLPGMNGIKCITELKSKCTATQFLMCTSYDDSNLIFKALKAGASGYILKTTQPSKIIEAISEIHFGGSPLSSQIARKVVNSFHTETIENRELQKLTAREKEILHLLSLGLRYKEISEKLFLSTETVRTHIRNIYEKLHVHSRTKA